MRKAPRRSGRAILASLVSLVMIALLPGSARAATGDLDPKFGGDGRVTTNVTSGYDGANDVAIQADGRIVVAGVADRRFALVRYNPDGTVDPRFGRGGAVRTDFKSGRYDAATAVVIQTNGKIVAVGSTGSWLAMVRYRPNGALDPTFSGNGKVVAAFMGGASDLAIQADGKIVVVGTSGTSFIAARYRHDGSLDPTFGTGGKVMTSVSDLSAYDAAVAIQPDGNIVVAGDESYLVGDAIWEDAVVVRYQTDGSLDPTFGTTGMVHAQLTRQFWGGHPAIQTDGKIVLAGQAGFCCEYSGKFGLIRLDPAGNLDPAFGGDGKVITTFTPNPNYEDAISDVAIQTNGKIVAVGVAGAGWGSVSTVAVARYRIDGTLDSTFGNGGKVRTRFPYLGTKDPDIYVGATAHGVAIQANGKILVVGGQSGENKAKDRILGMFVLARYLAR
jgi:uncharacterized delta-60 repeat protein